MKILITGISGFVGNNLVKALHDKYELIGLDLSDNPISGVSAIYTWEDLANGKLPQNIDAIIHLAGKAHDVKNTSGAEVYFQVNTELTKKIYDYFLLSSASKFIFFSSVKAAADFVPGDILTEDVVPNPVGPYGESKIKAEEYLLSNMSQLGKEVVILRPCMIHGPGNKGNLNLLYNVIRKGIPWPLGKFENRRSFTSIGNLTFALDKMLTMPIDSGIYHIGDDKALSTNELIAVMCGAMERKSRIWKLPKWSINSMAKLGTWLHLPLTEERLTKLTENYVVSNNKLKKALKIDVMPISAEEGLIATIKSFENINK